VIDGVQLEVADLDAHYEQARRAGAEILREPEDLPFGRLYSAADPEGHRWMVMQPS
jgi:PhnB protein